jgi:hypothetical protein
MTGETRPLFALRDLSERPVRGVAQEARYNVDINDNPLDINGPLTPHHVRHPRLSTSLDIQGKKARGWAICGGSLCHFVTPIGIDKLTK